MEVMSENQFEEYFQAVIIQLQEKPKSKMNDKLYVAITYIISL